LLRHRDVADQIPVEGAAAFGLVGIAPHVGAAIAVAVAREMLLDIEDLVPGIGRRQVVAELLPEGRLLLRVLE
jgi:hypothetical protein